MSLMFYVDDDRQMLSLLSLLRSNSKVKWKNEDGELRRTIHTYALQLFGTLYLHYIRS